MSAAPDRSKRANGPLGGQRAHEVPGVGATQ
jgi:hypothetical protein